MSETDEAMVEAIRRAVHTADNEWANAPRTSPHEPWDLYVAKAVATVPVVRDALARDAQVQVVLKKWEHDFRGDSDGVAIDAISNIYEDVSLDAGDRDDSEEQR